MYTDNLFTVRLVVFKNDNFQLNGDFELKDFDRMRNLTLASLIAMLVRILVNLVINNS